MFDVLPTETLFSSIVIAVEWQPPENNICAERAIDESQKFPWPRQHKNIKGTENNVEIVVKYPFAIGYLLSNLSPIIPDIKFEVSPKNVNEIA